MGIKFTADSNGADHVTGGGINATTWSQTFSDYNQANLDGGGYVKSGQSGGTTLHMPYYYTLTVEPRGEPGTGSYDTDGANRYYPVSFAAGSVRRASAMPNIVIYRHYGASGPYQWQQNNTNIGWTGSGTHQGGLYASYIVGDSAWSDMFEAQITRYRQTYHTTIAGHGMQLSYSVDRGSGPFWVMLRGGFEYQISASYPAMPRQVTANGSCFSYGGDDYFRRWPQSTTTVSTVATIYGDDGNGNGYTYGNTLTAMG